MQEQIFDLLNEKRKVVVFGDFMVDEYLHGATNRISPEAPVPVFLVERSERRLGGAGNVVHNLLALGADVAGVSFLGDDANGDWLRRELEERGVDCRGITQNEGQTTTVKTRITAQGQQLLRCDREAPCTLGDEDLDRLQLSAEAALEGACAVIISDYGKGVVTAESARIVIDLARSRGVPVIVDPKGSDYGKYRGATFCTPNMKELQQAVGRKIHSEEELREACLELCRNCGIENILATRSEKGLSLVLGATQEKTDYPAIAKEVIDVTGAGDTVISIFTLFFAAGAPLRYCCRIANLGASLVVSKFGCAVTTGEEMREALRQSCKRSGGVLSRAEAVKKAQELRAAGQKIVFTNGCFDIVHAGHISSFRQAKSFGDVLFLGLNSDASIRRIKGDKRPIVTAENRVKLLEAISYIDYIVFFDEDTPETLIEEIRPDVLVKGADWRGKTVAGAEFLASYGGEVKFIELEQGLSTSNIIQKVLDVYGEQSHG